MESSSLRMVVSLKGRFQTVRSMDKDTGRFPTVTRTLVNLSAEKGMDMVRSDFANFERTMYLHTLLMCSHTLHLVCLPLPVIEEELTFLLLLSFTRSIKRHNALRNRSTLRRQLDVKQ